MTNSPLLWLLSSANKHRMDERTLNAIAEWELQEDMRRAEDRAVSLGLIERDIDGAIAMTHEGEKQFLAWLHSETTLH